MTRRATCAGYLRATMAGGSSGEVLVAGDLESSRLWDLVAHNAQPVMPPLQDKLADAKLNLIKQWIEQGLPENAGSVVKKKNNAAAAMLTSSSSSGKPDGPPPCMKNCSSNPLSTHQDQRPSPPWLRVLGHASGCGWARTSQLVSHRERLVARRDSFPRR